MSAPLYLTRQEAVQAARIAELEAVNAELVAALGAVIVQWDRGSEPMSTLSLGGVARAALRRAEGGAK